MEFSRVDCPDSHQTSLSFATAFRAMLIVRPKQPEDEKEDSPPPPKRDVLLQPRRDFCIGEFQLSIAQSWASAPERDCTGHAVWSGGELLAHVLADDVCWQHACAGLSDAANTPPPSVIEIGCGVGCLPGLVCLLHRQLHTTFTDGSPKVLANAEKNVRANVERHGGGGGGDDMAALPDKMAFLSLPWHTSELPDEKEGQQVELQARPEEEPLLVLGSDVAYHVTMHGALLQTLATCLKKARHGRAAAIICNHPRGTSQDEWHRAIESSDLFDVVDLAPIARERLGDDKVWRHDVLKLTLKAAARDQSQGRSAAA